MLPADLQRYLWQVEKCCHAHLLPRFKELQIHCSDTDWFWMTSVHVLLLLLDLSRTMWVMKLRMASSRHLPTGWPCTLSKHNGSASKTSWTRESCLGAAVITIWHSSVLLLKCNNIRVALQGYLTQSDRCVADIDVNMAILSCIWHVIKSWWVDSQ